MRWRKHDRGFSLVETITALLLIAFAMTALLLAFGSSGKYGVLGRRQANAVAVGRSIAGQLSTFAYTNALLANTNTQNDANFADPNGLFAQAALPTGNDAPDGAWGTPVVIGTESYDVYVNIAPLMDPVNITLEQGRQFAVIVRYRVGNSSTNANEATWRRAVVLGYRYNPANMGVGQLPL
jgi:prepilin-type N-terminal cleavage/methylation domain-containing protein